MHDIVKAEVKYLKAQVNTSMATVDKLDSKLGRKATAIAKLQQEMKTALKK
jgi:predicted transcriptional regulator